jgi:hypothetical protein
MKTETLENELGKIVTKVDRALERRVIDWLQWNEFPYDKNNPNMPELALQLIAKRKQERDELRKRLDALLPICEMILEKKHRYPRYWHEIKALKFAMLG